MRRQKEAPLFECVIVLSEIYRLLERSIVLFKRALLIRPMVSIVLRPSSSVSSKGNLSSDEITPGRLPGVPEILGCHPVCRLNWKKVVAQLEICESQSIETVRRLSIRVSIQNYSTQSDYHKCRYERHP